jgi:ribonuclease T1
MSRRWPLVAAIVIALFTLAPPTHARSTPEGMATIAVAQLPPEGRAVYTLILKGGPFKYDRDGIAFGNREKMLPAKPHGYYHEYTVPTAGATSRGARRIVCGGPRTAPDACYYSDDHYQSFKRIRP